MGLVREIIEAEYKRNLQAQMAYHQALAKLPRGSIGTKAVNGNVYYYWVYREQGKVVNKYISARSHAIGVLMIQVRKRRLMEKILRSLKEDQAEMERFLRLTRD